MASFGYGVGDFIAVGKIVLKTIQTLRDSTATIERLGQLDQQIEELQNAIVDCRNCNSGIDTSNLKLGRHPGIADGIAKMSLDLGRSEEAIFRFRRELEPHRKAIEALAAANLKAPKRREWLKQKVTSVDLRLNIAADLQAALTKLEEELSVNMLTYELNKEKVKTMISTYQYQQQMEKLYSISEQIAQRSGIGGDSRTLQDISKMAEMMETMLAMQKDFEARQLQEADKYEIVRAAISANTEKELDPAPAATSELSIRKVKRVKLSDVGELTERKMELVQARAEAVLVPLIVMIWVILRCLKQAFVKALPQELGYSWSSKAGFLGITILDAIGRELPVPMDLCVSFENLHGVIEIYFRGKKGHRKVTRGEYCLTYGDGSDIKPISTERDLVRARRPGSRLAMFMEVNVGRKPRNTPHQVEEEIEGTQICPQCGVANYPTKDDEFGVKCIGCGSEVRIFEDVTEISKVIAPEYDNELGSESYTGTLSRSIRLRSSPLCEAIERFNEHAGDCFVCRNPMRSYQSTRPRCDTGDRVSRPIRDEFERLRSLQPSGEDDEGSSGASNGSGIINIPEAYGYSAKLVGVLNVISASEEHIVPSTSNGGRGRSDSRTTSSFVRVYMVSKKSKKKSDVVNEDLAKESNPIKSAAEKTTMPTQVHSDGDEESDFVDDLDGWDEDEDGIWDDETLWKEDSRLNPVESNDIPPISDENGLIIFDPVSRSHDLSNPLVEAKDDDVYINDDHLIIIDDYSEPPAFKLLRPKKDVGCRFLIPSRPEVQVEIVTVLEILIPVAMTNKETLQDTVIGHIERRHGIIFNRRTGEKIKQLNSKDGKNVGHTFSPIVPVAGISLEELGPIEFEPGSKSSAHHQKQCREKTILDPDFRGRYGECYCDMDDEFSSKELLDAYTQALMSSPPEPDSDEDSDELSESDELERYY